MRAGQVEQGRGRGYGSAGESDGGIECGREHCGGRVSDDIGPGRGMVCRRVLEGWGEVEEVGSKQERASWSCSSVCSSGQRRQFCSFYNCFFLMLFPLYALSALHPSGRSWTLMLKDPQVRLLTTSR